MQLRGEVGSAIAAVITVVPEELRPARRIFNAQAHVLGTPFYVETLNESNTYDVVLRKCADRSNGPAGNAVAETIRQFRPAFLFLVGIAGGVCGRDDLALGDVVIADYVEYYEVQKLFESKQLMRRVPYDHPSAYLRTSFAEPVIESFSSPAEWVSKISHPRPQPGYPTEVIKRRGYDHPMAIVGNLAAGEKLLSDTKSNYQQTVLQSLDKALAIEMEAYGFLRAVFESRGSRHYNPQALIIRGISDPVNSDENGGEAGEHPNADELRKEWRSYAADAAATFAHEVVMSVIEVHRSLPVEQLQADETRPVT